jgi:hypothetical protein
MLAPRDQPRRILISCVSPYKDSMSDSFTFRLSRLQGESPCHTLDIFTMFRIGNFSQSQSYLRQTVGQSALVSGHNQGPYQLFFLLEIFLRQYRVCYFMVPALTRGLVCNLLLLLSVASAVRLEFETRGTQCQCPTALRFGCLVFRERALVIL